jgi:hypothetical protein
LHQSGAIVVLFASFATLKNKRCRDDGLIAAFLMPTVFDPKKAFSHGFAQIKLS